MSSSTSDITTIAVVHFERNDETAQSVATALRSQYKTVDLHPYHSSIFAEQWEQYDGFVAIMAVGIVTRKIAPHLTDKWTDPAVVVVDEQLQWAIPLLGGHHGGMAIATALRTLDVVPTVTTATTAAGKQSVEQQADAVAADVVTEDSTVATNLAILRDNLGPVTRIEGPQAVLVDEDVTVLKRHRDNGIVIGTGSVEGATASQFHAAWQDVLKHADRDWSAVEFVATGRPKEGEAGLYAAADREDLGVVVFDKETLHQFAGPTASKATELIDWPGLAEASAKAGGRQHELLVEKHSYDRAVTAAIGQ